MDQKWKTESEEEFIANRIRDKEKERSVMYEEVEKLRQLRKQMEEAQRVELAKEEEILKKRDEEMKEKNDEKKRLTEFKFRFHSNLS